MSKKIMWTKIHSRKIFKFFLISRVGLTNTQKVTEFPKEEITLKIIKESFVFNFSKIYSNLVKLWGHKWMHAWNLLSGYNSVQVNKCR